MNIAVIGAGFTGLSAAYQLSKKGHRVAIFEKEHQPGGLAIGFTKKGWDWTLEQHYHHWFTNDESVLSLAKELDYEVITKRPKTSVHLQGSSFQLDSPRNLLMFSKLTLSERLRMAAVLAILRYNPFWLPLERIRAHAFLKAWMGEKAYEMIWEPQLLNKFGRYAHDISLAWFWARVKKRTASLAYPKKGFLAFAEALVKEIGENSGKVLFNIQVTEIKSEGGKVRIDCFDDSNHRSNSQHLYFDKAIVTVPSYIFVKIAPDLPDLYKTKLVKLKGLGAVNLVLRLKKQFIKDNTYWLSVCEKNAPLMAIVEHTNFMDKKHYNNEHIVYLGNYVEKGHPYFALNEKELLNVFDPFLTRINPEYRASLIAAHLFKAPFAQPIIPINYSKLLPPFETPLKHVYLANIEQVYPWDRGTNYAVELGKKVANLIERK